MTPHEFYEQLAKVTEQMNITLSPGPFKVNVNSHDAMAAKLILWLEEQMPEDATTGDLFDVLDAAHWWATFWLSHRRTEQ